MSCLRLSAYGTKSCAAAWQHVLTGVFSRFRESGCSQAPATLSGAARRQETPARGGNVAPHTDENEDKGRHESEQVYQASVNVCLGSVNEAKGDVKLGATVYT